MTLIPTKQEKTALRNRYSPAKPKPLLWQVCMSNIPGAVLFEAQTASLCWHFIKVNGLKLKPKAKY